MRKFLPALALPPLLGLGACSLLRDQVGERCKAHAHLRLGVESFINNRYSRDAPVRLGVIPFSAPANVSGVSDRRVGVGFRLASILQAKLLEYQLIPIIELVPREDWPGKLRDFHEGNHDSIALGREMGYDLVLVGAITHYTLEQLTFSGRILETEAGITVWYGTVNVSSNRPILDRAVEGVGLQKHTPSRLYIDEILEEAGRCIAREAMKEE